MDSRTQNFHPAPWRNDLSAGLIGGAVAVIFAVSHAALLFPGPLRAYLPYAVGMTLVTAMAGAFFMAWRSQLPFAIAGTDSNTTSILAAAASTFATTAGAGMPVLENVLLLLLIATLSCAATFFLLGIGRLASAVRYIPFPVIGGFLAATGWLIAVGALRVGADLSPDADWLEQLPHLLRNAQWLATLGLGLAFTFIFRRWRHPAVLPVVLVAACCALLGALALAGLQPRQAREAGWLFDGGAPAQWLPPWKLAGATELIDWRWIAHQWLDVVAVVMVAVVSVLLGAAGLEVMAQRDIALQRELRTHGWMNLVSPVLGGYLSLVSVSRSAVLLESRAHGRTAAFVVAALCAVALPVAARGLEWVPRPVLGGFLLSIGLGILHEWVVKSRRRTSLVDWTLIVVILATAAAIGFTVAMLVGIIASCINFAVSYSRVGVVQHDLDASSIRSSVTRPIHQQEFLAARGSAVRVLVLRGMVFFGTAHALLERVRPFLEGHGGVRPHALVLDFTHVASIDSSAELTFEKMTQLAQMNGVWLLACGTSERAAREAVGKCSVYRTLDQALDAAEESLLTTAAPRVRDQSVSLDAWLGAELGPLHFEALRPHLERRELAAGEVLLRQGDESDTTLYFIESGRLAITLEGQAEGQRLACLMAANIVGEMALYSNIDRSATVTAETGSVVWALSRAALETLHASSPETPLRVHAFVMETMARRIQLANAAIAALQRGA